MSADVDQVSSEELQRYRAELTRLRVLAIESADQAIKAVMVHNGTVLRRIDAAMAELEPRPGESEFEHRRRIEVAIMQLHSDETDFEG